MKFALILSASLLVSVAPVWSQAEPDTDAFPVTITNCGTEWTYDTPPERVLATDTPAFETLIALGLEDRIVGWYGARHWIHEDWEEAANDIERFGGSFPYPSLEAAVGELHHNPVDCPAESGKSPAGGTRIKAAE